MDSEFTTDRGNPWEYDPGPPRNRKWPRLFSETPNYRTMGVHVIGREFFRWHFGPMYYRGRLGDNDVKVLVIGQEGAQDESLCHRSFIGGTGSRLQHLLTHFGITHSYLFLNTFTYPIAGQYVGDKTQWLAQDANSPIRKQRHEIFDYVLERNAVDLVIGVGRAARESVQTWVESRGGQCPDGSGNLTTCESHVLGPSTRCIGVLHPGAAAAAGGLAKLKVDFKRAAVHIEQWSQSDSTWLVPDTGSQAQAASSFEYGKAPIPFRDLPYGTNWRLGYRSTTSIRHDDQTSIQLFSADGRSRPDSADLPIYEGNVDGSNEGFSMEPGDVPYEPPVKHYDEYDRGPGAFFARLFAGAESRFAWPDFKELGIKAHPSFGQGPIYRGRTHNAAVIVLADQQGHDDLFIGRALCGEAGQRFQTFLTAMGVRENYIILRVLPVDALGLAEATMQSVLNHPRTVAIYRRMIEQIAARASMPPVLIAMGENARQLAEQANQLDLTLVNCKSWDQDNTSMSWNLALDRLQELDYKREIDEPSYHFDGSRSQIPRHDLPYGCLRWQATSGDRARRALVNDEASHDYYKITMPAWTAALQPEPLSRSEQIAVNQAPD